MTKENYGWICPACGVPNSPLNKTCAACFTAYHEKTPNLQDVLWGYQEDKIPSTQQLLNEWSENE